MFKMNSGGIRFSVDDFLTIRSGISVPLGKFSWLKQRTLCLVRNQPNSVSNTQLRNSADMVCAFE
jgi:hypothetical protein